MSNLQPPELFPDPRMRPQRRRKLNTRQKRGVAMLVIACMFFAAGGIYTLMNMDFSETTDIPLIKAEDGPVKERPTTPGGIDVPHQNSTIFDRFNNKEQEKDVEHILPPPEMPNNQAVETGGIINEPPAQTVPAPEPAKPEPKPEPAAEVQKTATQPSPSEAPATPVEKPAPAEPEKAPPAPEPQPKPPAKNPDEHKTETPPKPAPPKDSAAGGGQSRIQLAASPSQQEAEDKMLSIVSEHAGIMRQVKLSVVKADLGARGVFYRIQSQAMPTAAAQKLCADLKAAGMGCILAKAQ